MILYHGSYLEIDKPNLQVCFRTSEVINALRFEGGEVV